jgi:hypothetical protein
MEVKGSLADACGIGDIGRRARLVQLVEVAITPERKCRQNQRPSSLT